MRVNIERLSKRLATSGFILSYFDNSTLEVVFVKPHSSELFGRIQIGRGFERGGKAGDIVTAGVECSIVPGRTFLKGMGEHRCLLEVATDPTRGSSKLANDTEAQTWEERLGMIGPRRVGALCVEHGPTIAHSTQSVRQIGLECLEMCRNIAPTPRQAMTALEVQLHGWELGEYRRILGCPIQVIPNGRLYYQIAVLAIVLYSGKAKGNTKWFVGKKPRLRHRARVDDPDPIHGQYSRRGIGLAGAFFSFVSCMKKDMAPVVANPSRGSLRSP